VRSVVSFGPTALGFKPEHDNRGRGPEAPPFLSRWA
jgi:hypothetical protein